MQRALNTSAQARQPHSTTIHNTINVHGLHLPPRHTEKIIEAIDDLQFILAEPLVFDRQTRYNALTRLTELLFGNVN